MTGSDESDLVTKRDVIEQAIELKQLANFREDLVKALTDAIESEVEVYFQPEGMIQSDSLVGSLLANWLSGHLDGKLTDGTPQGYSLGERLTDHEAEIHRLRDRNRQLEADVKEYRAMNHRMGERIAALQRQMKKDVENE